MTLKKWKTLSRKEVFEHPRMHLVEDEAELPDGHVVKYLRHAPAISHSVTIIAVNDTGELLLQREYSYPPDEVMWQLPGGSIERNESVIEAAGRELSEESGLVAGEYKIIGYYYVNNRRSDQKQYVVVGRMLSQNIKRGDQEEFIESRWMPVAEVERKIRDGEFHNMNLLASLNMWLHVR